MAGLDRPGSEGHIALMLIRTEQTPNPATRKFLPGQPVMETRVRDFADAAAAEASPLANALFDSGLVEGVFYGGDFISVTAAPGVSWTDLEPLVIETLLDHFVSGAPLFAPGTAAGIHIAADDFDDRPEDAEIIDQIKELIETRVRPAVAQDGGDIRVLVRVHATDYRFLRSGSTIPVHGILASSCSAIRRHGRTALLAEVDGQDSHGARGRQAPIESRTLRRAPGANG